MRPQRREEVIVDGLYLEGPEGQAEEREYVWFARVVDPRQLRAAAHTEELEQWLIRTASDVRGGTVRARCTNGRDYEITVKNHTGYKGGAVTATETNQPCSKEMFEAFKAVAPRGSHKVRYVFPIGDGKHKWEVDTYAGTEYCKVDLELPAGVEVPDFPVDLDHVMRGGDPEFDKEIKELYDNVFALTNKRSILPLMQ
jgi:hypothetical protein